MKVLFILFHLLCISKDDSTKAKILQNKIHVNLKNGVVKIILLRIITGDLLWGIDFYLEDFGKKDIRNRLIASTYCFAGHNQTERSSYLNN